MQKIKPKKNIRKIRINRMQGRVLRLPAKNKSGKRILFVYGSHASIERNYGIAEALSNYADVSFPDMPGFGGMDSFYSVGMKPTIDNLADYLAAFVRLEYGDRKRFSIYGFSLGFFVAQRMLERYPELSKRVDVCMSLGGMTAGDEFVFGEDRKEWQIRMSGLLSYKIPSIVYRYTALSRFWIMNFYAKSRLAKPKFEGMTKAEKKQALRHEVTLWHINDVRTWAYAINQLLKAKKDNETIPARLWHTSISGDQYLKSSLVKKRLKQKYKHVRNYSLVADNHSPVMIDTEELGFAMIPKNMQSDLKHFFGK